MARRRRRDKDVMIDGLLGALQGGLKFKLDEMTRKQVEDADLRKEARLDAIQARRDEINHQRTVERDASQAALTAERDALLASQQDSRDARQHEYKLAETDAAAAHARSLEGVRQAGSRETARITAESRDPRAQTWRGSDGRVYQIPVSDAGRDQLQTLQDGGVKLQLMEGSAGSRMSEYETGFDDYGATAPTSGAAPKPAAAPSMVYDPKLAKLVPYRQ